MKIDLHCHTKKTKMGDKETRNVTTEKFVEVLSENQVGFVAITNHNLFDVKQYEEFKEKGKNETIDVWPGIELDVIVNKEEGHMLIICNPECYRNFDSAMANLIGTKSPDDFSIDFDQLLFNIKDLDVMIIAHSFMKSHGFSEKATEFIRDKIQETIPFLLEPSSLKSVGIMYANNINGIIGSDVSDWNNYPIDKVPTLKMDIKDYATFKLLVKKDSKTVETFLKQKEIERVEIQPFLDEGDQEKISLNIFDDINIIFGGKGTGKSKITTALKNHFEKSGNTTVSYYSGQVKEDKYDELVKRDIKEDYFECFEVDDCKSEFEIIKQWNESNIVPTSLFYKGFQTQGVNKNFLKFGFKNATFNAFINAEKYDLEKEKFTNISKAIQTLLLQDVGGYLSDQEFENLKQLLNKIRANAFIRTKNEWLKLKSFQLEKYTIEEMKNIGLSKSGNYSVPASTGIIDFYSNIYRLFKAANKIHSRFSMPHKTKKDFVGFIPEKGNIYVVTKIYLNPSEDTRISYQNNKPTSNTIKSIVRNVNTIYQNAFKGSVAQNISEFNKLCANNCLSLKDCFGIKSGTYVDKDGTLEIYNASSGEKSMLLLNNSLVDSGKRVYILDEPELSVGHKYINEVIVPRLKELSTMNKKVIVCTHDANIAVRTLPLNTIYREFKKTYVGNLFIDELEEQYTKEKISWTDTSLSYLEGGESAFKERGDSYGK